MREAANAAQLKRNFAGSDLLYVPEIHWDFCRPNVLTMERIFGIQVDDIEALRSAGTDIKRLAENGVEIFFTQVFRHNFFHADMHPGNIFVDVTDPQQPKYVAVDFGIVGTLDERDQHYLAENFLAFFRRDYRRVATLHVDSSWVPPGTRVDELEAAVRAVCEPIFNKPLKDISFGLVLLRLFQTARQFNMEVQPQLVLLQKTLLAIEGLGRQLYPELDLWKTAKPVLEQWMRERHDPRTRFKQLVEAWPEISDDLALLPRLLHRALRRADADDAAARRQQRAPVVVGGAAPRYGAARAARHRRRAVDRRRAVERARSAGVARLGRRGGRARDPRVRAAAPLIASSQQALDPHARRHDVAPAPADGHGIERPARHEHDDALVGSRAAAARARCRRRRGPSPRR